MMVIGTLSTSVVLSEPRRVHYGCEAIVTGHVSLHYTSTLNDAATAELFGPLSVVITLRGRAKTKIWHSDGNTRQIYRGGAPLFSISHIIHDGPIRLLQGSTHQVPFALSFPDRVQHISHVEEWQPDGRFNTEAGSLPPTFSISYSGFVHRFDAFTEYRLGAVSSMYGIDLRTVNVEEDNEPAVLYSQPEIPMSQASYEKLIHTQQVKLQNKHLLPEHEHPSGLREKAKALFKSDYFPEYHFEVQLHAPVALYVGSVVAFEIVVRPLYDRCTAPVPPVLDVTNFAASLTAYTDARAERQLFTERDSNGSETVLDATGIPDAPGPFSEANAFTKRVNISPLPDRIPITFSTFNIARKYTMKIACTISGAKTDTVIGREIPIVLYSRITADYVANDSQAYAGNSQEYYGVQTEQLAQYGSPPFYQETGAQW